MEELTPLSDFFAAIQKDGRISITHIGIYAAVLQCWYQADQANPFRAFSYDVMKIAKISASTTYHKVIRDLNEYGYLKYEPSFKRNQGSKIYLLIRE